MSHVIELRKRIKAIETIRKITHAMRLISMSAHTRLKARQEPLNAYIDATRSLLERIKPTVTDWHHPLVAPASLESTQTLIILIGSQKGLCGNFNSALFYYLEHDVLPSLETEPVFIAIGRKSVDYITTKKFPTLALYPELSTATLTPLSEQLLALLLGSAGEFRSVMVVSNKIKSFFIQKPQRVVIVPDILQTSSAAPIAREGYLWHQPAHEVLHALIDQFIQAQLHYLLFQSLLAEQAARFLSMDNSTRSARNLLDTARLQYNKLRQARITKELTELTGGF